MVRPVLPWAVCPHSYAFVTKHTHTTVLLLVWNMSGSTRVGLASITPRSPSKVIDDRDSATGDRDQ